MPELSIIVPFINEWPQLVFTIGNIHEELRDRVDFEIIAVDNWCQQAERQKRKPDRSHKQLYEIEKGQPWLKVVKYEEKLSHWNAKRVGVDASSGGILWFCDAHCLVSRDALVTMFQYYRKHHAELDGSLHLPLTYQILEWRQLIYELVVKRKKGVYHYRFKQHKYRPRLDGPFEVPVMSTCGMMITRKLYDEVGGWPPILGIYGGGENFINFTLAVLGKKKFIMPGSPLRHHGDRRGYNYEARDYLRNRCAATYLFGGVRRAELYLTMSNRCEPGQRNSLLTEVLDQCNGQRGLIKSQQVVDIDEWIKEWP